jgi:hypothetical protein
MFQRLLSVFILISICSITFSTYQIINAAVGDYTGISFDTGGNTSPQGVVVYGGFFYFIDSADDEVYKFNLDGTYTGTHFDTAGSGADNVFDITVYNDFFWLTDFTDDEVYKYNPDGTYTGVSFDTAASGAGNVTGITAYNDFFWLLDSSDDEVYKYNPDGTYTGVSFDTGVSGAGNAGSILAYNDFFWIADGSDDLIYKYNPDGTYTGDSLDTSAVTIGIDALAVANDLFWIIDDQEDLAYQFDPLNDLTGVFFNTTINGTASPYGITTDNNNFWIIGDAYQHEKVVEYELDGTYTGDFFFLDPTHQSGSDFRPEAVLFYDGFLWVGASVNGDVFKYNLDGTYTGVFFDTDVANTNLGGVAVYNDFFWITDTAGAEVFKYNLDGTYTGISFDTAGDGVFSPAGITAYNDFLWIVDNAGAIYKYNPDGTYAGISFNTFASGNIFPWGITVYDDFFYVTNQNNKEVYKYEGEPETVAPTVSTFSPVDGAVDVATDSNLIITFDEAVDVVVGNILIKKASDDSTVQTIDVLGGHVTGTGTNIITINPSDLEEGEDYYIQIDATAFDDLVGNSYVGIADATTWNFRTENRAPSGGGSGSVRHLHDDPVTPPVIPPVEPEDPITPPPTPPVIDPPTPPQDEVDVVIDDEEEILPEEPIVPVLPDDEVPPVEPPTDNGGDTGDVPTPTPPDSNDVGYLDYVEDFTTYIKTPEGNLISKSITTFGLALGFLVVLLSNISTFSELGLKLFQLWSMFLYGVGLKKRNRPWGVVYDSITKQPLDPVYVVLIDAKGNEIATSITDMDGRYGFLVEPGFYKIRVNKNNYTYPSEKLKGKISDELYNDLYFGDVIEIKQKGEVITKNIPMDQVGFNWNEYIKKEQGKSKFYNVRDVVVSKFVTFMSVLGFLTSFAIIFILPKPYNLIVFALYIVLFALKKTKLVRNRMGNVVYDKNGRPLAFGILRMFSGGTEIAHRVLDKEGNYYLLIGNGRYALSLEKKNEDMTYSKVFSAENVQIKHGILTKKFRI